MEKSVNISQISALATIATEYCRMDDNYLLAHIKGDSKTHTIATTPMRIDGMAFVLCRQGSITLSVNLEHQLVTGNTLLGIGPDKLISFEKVENGEVDLYILFLSHSFLHNLNIDLRVLDSIPAINISPNPVLPLDAEEISLLENSFSSLYLNTLKSDKFYLKPIAQALVVLICYQVMQFMSKRVDHNQVSEQPRSRRAMYALQFRQLVHKYHCRERSVAFYAGKMFISPKYLSLVIKETTGRTAAEWIDDYVILEAKNLLRFSGKNVQQIAYELNFPNQGSFGKYFKHLTGLSPTAYQRS